MINTISVWEIFADFSENFLFTYFLFSRLKITEGKHKKVLALSMVLLCTAFASLCYLLEIRVVITQSVLYLIRLFIIIRYFSNSFAEKIFVNCLPNFTSMLASQFIYTINVFISARHGNLISAENEPYMDYLGDHPILSMMLCLFFEFVFLVLFARVLKSITRVPSKIYTFLMIAAMIALASTTTFLNAIIETGFWILPMRYRLHLSTLCFIMLFLFIAMAFLAQITGNTYERNLAVLEQLHQKEMIEERGKSLLQSVESLRQWKHDYKNHLSVMQELLANGNYERLKEYIAVQKDTLPQSFSEISTGHTIIDAILTGKYAEMNASGISFHYSVLLPKKLPLSDIEVTGILGNLLDNAIEACRLCTEKSETAPYITLAIKPQRGIVRICVKNTSNGNYHYDKKRNLETTKADTSLHGNGLKQIRSIVENHGGFCKITAAETDFTVDAVIPLEKLEGETV